MLEFFNKRYQVHLICFAGVDKLGINKQPVRVVLEKDGTEIDEDDIFMNLEKNEIVLLLQPGEEWTKEGDDVFKQHTVSIFIGKSACEAFQ